jgi:hypothetical protein
MNTVRKVAIERAVAPRASLRPAAGRGGTAGSPADPPLIFPLIRRCYLAVIAAVISLLFRCYFRERRRKSKRYQSLVREARKKTVGNSKRRPHPGAARGGRIML